MPAITIRADGIDWPLQTYLDAYGFRQVDRFIRPEIDGHRRVCTIDDVGQLHGPDYADQVSWHAVLAWRPLDPIDAPEPCFLCGTTSDALDLYDECRDSAEYDA